jgi:hypothetical protein
MNETMNSMLCLACSMSFGHNRKSDRECELGPQLTEPSAKRQSDGVKDNEATGSRVCIFFLASSGIGVAALLLVSASGTQLL